MGIRLRYGEKGPGARGGLEEWLGTGAGCRKAAEQVWDPDRGGRNAEQLAG